MKIQDLAIIFVIIILPISLVLSAYAQYQIQTVNNQTLYDSQLTEATHDAIKAYQINAENSTTSELANSKIRDIEASVTTFKNSIMSSFRLNGYTEEELNNYIPALVYTMYDGFYIYSPFENIADNEGNIIADGDNIYGLRPYITYSCRYIKGDIDVVITYALDNYIKVQGMIGTEYVNKGGYLVDGISVDGNIVKYNDMPIESEQLKEYLPIPRADSVPADETSIPYAYSYVKINGTKYYRVNINPDILGEDSIIYFLNGTMKVQCQKTGEPDDDFSKYSTLIDDNNQARQYYKDASGFTNWVKVNLSSLKWCHAVHDIGNVPIWEDNTINIFDDSNIENETSNFNQHRLAVIRQKIEENLSTSIANYNLYSGSINNDFQMPKLKEDEWDYLTHNIALISFLQGLPIGGKIYNGYTIVTNTESKEVVLEPNIYILGRERDDNELYYRIGDENIATNDPEVQIDVGHYGTGTKSGGRLNLDFKRKMITNNNKALYYYPLQDYNASYSSIIMQDKVNLYEDIYEYINAQSLQLKNAFYTALGRERYAKYNSTTILDNGYFTKLGVTSE